MAHEAELTRTPELDTAEPDTAEVEPLNTEPLNTEPPEAGPLRPGKAARAVVSDGHAVHAAIEAVLAAPGESREVASERTRRCATGSSTRRLT